MITASTRLLGVIGWPVGHSRSPAMHNAALDALGLDFFYTAFAVPPALLPTAISGAAALGVRGLSVTIPHKEKVLALCEPDALAVGVGAVNVLTFEGDQILGTNTDVHGFAVLRDTLGASDRARTVILGAGGAARAVVAAMHPSARVTLIARTPRPLSIGGRPVDIRPWDQETLSSLLPEAELLVDATPRGLRDEPVDPGLSLLRPDAVVIDLVVRGVTPIVAAARARGLRAEAGATMLLHQGVRAFELWTGRTPPIDVMRAALDASLAGK